MCKGETSRDKFVSRSRSGTAKLFQKSCGRGLAKALHQTGEVKLTSAVANMPHATCTESLNKACSGFRELIICAYSLF